MEEIYNLKYDVHRIRNTQVASLDPSPGGLMIDNGKLFGSEEWFKAIDSGEIVKFRVTGVITDLPVSGHNDFFLVEVGGNGEKTIWERLGKFDEYRIGRKIDLYYVLQRFKTSKINILGETCKCILKVDVDTGFLT